MIKVNSQHKHIAKKSMYKEIRLKSSRGLALPTQTRFVPQEAMNEPALKEGFSLPWISNEGFRLNDRLILDCCHYIEVTLLFALVAFIYLVKDKHGWDTAILSALFVTIMVGYYRTVLFEKLNMNLHGIISRVGGGKFTPGNAILSAPPQVRFDYEGHDCYVMSVIDQNFKLVLEYSCFFGKESEFRIEKSKKGEGHTLVFGHDKELVKAALKNPHINGNIETILMSFNYISYGKDGIMHVGESFDGRLTETEMVLDTFERIVSFGKILKLDEEGQSS
jgi:hypothetical protein